MKLPHNLRTKSKNRCNMLYIRKYLAKIFVGPGDVVNVPTPKFEKGGIHTSPHETIIFPNKKEIVINKLRNL